MKHKSSLFIVKSSTNLKKNKTMKKVMTRNPQCEAQQAHPPRNLHILVFIQVNRTISD